MRHLNLSTVRGRTVVLTLLILVLGTHALRQIAINGDGGEYLMMTHAFFRHGSPGITPADLQDYLRLPVAERAQIGYPSDVNAALIERLRQPWPMPWAGYAAVGPDRVYAIHFWAYSLLALPIYAVLYGAGSNPVLALGILNLLFVAAVPLYLVRALPRQAFLGSVLFLAAGTTFYVGFTGPEVMAAACAFIATVALLRGDPGLCMCVAGLGATQNPSLAFIMPFAVLVGWLQRHDLRAAPRSVRLRAAALALAGVLLGLMPYAFFRSLFGIPSLSGHYFTRPEEISLNRAHSMLFDLNQGLIAGAPGLMLAVALGAWVVLARRLDAVRKGWLIVPAAIAAMAVPTLGAINWNCGGVVFMRYAYWLAMPGLALLVVSMDAMTDRHRLSIGAAALALQTGVFVQDGWWGERSSVARFSPQAAWVLDHVPEYYNPDPEIFYERGVGHEVEAPLATDSSFLYQRAGQPLKLLRHESNRTPARDACPARHVLRGENPVHADQGWIYEHAPFRCEELAEASFVPNGPSALCAPQQSSACALDSVNGVKRSDVTRVQRSASARLAGWAADERGSVPPLVFVELDGAEHYFAPSLRRTERPDVASRNAALLHSGYEVVASFEAVPPGEYRVVILQIASDGNATTCDSGKKIRVD